MNKIMKNKFVPYPDKIHIEPFKNDEDSILRGEENSFQEMGKVIAVGKDVKFCKVGDTIFFSSWGTLKTPEVKGVQYYVVSDSPQFILGKLSKGDGREK